MQKSSANKLQGLTAYDCMIRPPREEAERLIEALHQALEAGHPPGAALRVVAEAHGLHPATLRSRVALSGAYQSVFGLKVDWERYQHQTHVAPCVAPPEASEPIPPESTAMDRRTVALERENAGLREKLRTIHRDELDSDAIREIIGGVASAPAEPPSWLLGEPKKQGRRAEVPVTIWSDFHAGEVVSLSETNGQNEFNTEILKRRVRRLVERTVYLLREHGPNNYPGIVINLLGDFVSGGLHPELLKTDEEGILPTVLRMRDLLIWALDQMIRAFGKVYCPCTSGNHGRSTNKPEYKEYVYKNFDWLIYQLLARHFAGNKSIIFDIPDSNEVLYRVYGQRYLAMHGDMLAGKGGDGIIGALGPIMRGETKVGRQAAAMGRDYDVLLIGHWHQQIWLPRLICANSLKGFDEYAQRALRASPSVPSQPLWLVHPQWGRTSHREVLLEDPVAEKVAEWCSFSKKVA